MTYSASPRRAAWVSSSCFSRLTCYSPCRATLTIRLTPPYHATPPIACCTHIPGALLALRPSDLVRSFGGELEPVLLGLTNKPNELDNVQSASSMIESSSDADAEMSPTKVLTALLAAGALGGTTSTANAFQAPTSMHGGVVMVYTPASRPQIRMAAGIGNDDPESVQTSWAERSLASATPIHQSSVYTQSSDYIDGERIPARGTSGRLLAAVKAIVQKEVDIVGGNKSYSEQRMGVQMLNALREELLLAGEPAPKKRLCVFDFDGTLTDDYASSENRRAPLKSSAQRVADLRNFLETLHADSHLVVCSINDQHEIVRSLREANLLDLFDIVVDAYHMAHLGLNKGRALNELLLPLFPSVGGPGDCLFVDDNFKKIREVKVSAPACRTFMCSPYGISSADMHLLLNEKSCDAEMSEGVREAAANEARALWEGGDEGMRKHHEQLKRIRKENTREKLKNAMQTGSVKDLQQAIQKATSWPNELFPLYDELSGDESDVALVERARAALAALEAEDVRDVEMS